MENLGRLGTNARARTGHIAGHGERVESNGGSERSREGRSATCASAKWSAREGRGGMGARRPTRGAFSAGRFGATTGSRAGALPSHFPIRRGWETRSGPTATSADRRDESHSRPTIRGNRRVVNRENAVGDRPGRRLAAPSARSSPLFFWKRAFHAAVPAVLTPRDTLARKQETPNDFGPPQGPTHDVGLRQRRRGRLRVHPGERRV